MEVDTKQIEIIHDALTVFMQGYPEDFLNEDQIDDLYNNIETISYWLKNYPETFNEAISQYYDLNRNFLLEDISNSIIKTKGTVNDKKVLTTIESIVQPILKLKHYDIQDDKLEGIYNDLLNIKQQISDLEILKNINKTLDLNIDFHDDKHLVFS